MNLYFLSFALILSIASCQNSPNQTTNEPAKENLNSAVVSKTEKYKSDEPKLVESFSDDEKIGNPRKNKIEITNLKKAEGNFKNSNIALIKFYSLDSNKEWKLQQTFEFEKDDITDIDPVLEDFNNDGYKDITYVSDVAARGANEVRKLFIYDKMKDELVLIKNSENYPNMLYNKQLNCIDAWLFHGGTSTVFLKIDGNMLKEFASVHTDSHRTIYVIDENGQQKLLKKEEINEDEIYQRYKNYNPPEIYKD